MFKQGKTPVPIRQVPSLAHALEVDPAWLLRLALRYYQPEVLETVGATMGLVVTVREVEIVKVLRELTDNTDPRLAGPGQSEKLKEFGEVPRRRI